eukprot:6191831-Pleurochrysis_carterae.AAC.1
MASAAMALVTSPTLIRLARATHLQSHVLLCVAQMATNNLPFCSVVSKEDNKLHDTPPKTKKIKKEAGKVVTKPKAVNMEVEKDSNESSDNEEVFLKFKRKIDTIKLDNANAGTENLPPSSVINKKKNGTQQPTFAEGEIVMARWMLGKKHLIAKGCGRGQCGKWFQAKVLKVDIVSKTAAIKYTQDKWEEPDPPTVPIVVSIFRRNLSSACSDKSQGHTQPD